VKVIGKNKSVPKAGLRKIRKLYHLEPQGVAFIREYAQKRKVSPFILRTALFEGGRGMGMNPSAAITLWTCRVELVGKGPLAAII
jgi:hypothetical protein